ncbi:PREDICTED: histone-lysine N-methyltransferase PRDM9-like [Cyprinodon variegatus]|nr:PREDICTED: histone-lysine N-methyltransferase PRDM9-like [Cyprinodon variegatus]
MPNKVLEEKLQEINGASEKSVNELKERTQGLEKELDNANDLLSTSKLRGPAGGAVLAEDQLTTSATAATVSKIKPSMKLTEVFNHIMPLTTLAVVPDNLFLNKRRNSGLIQNILNTGQLEEEQDKEDQKEMQPKETTEVKKEPEPQLVDEKGIELWIFQGEGLPLVKQEISTSMGTAADTEWRMEAKEEPNPVGIKVEEMDIESGQMIDTKEEPEPFPMKEQAELDIVQNKVQPLGNQETQPLILTPAVHQNDYSEPETIMNHMLPQIQQTMDPRNNTASGSFVCKTCGRSYTERRSLARHMRSHSGETPYQCVLCEKYYCDRNTLNYHLRTHTGEKPFGCTMCSKSFIQRHTLVRHMRTHSENKPFACELCEKSYCDQNTLNYHMRSHRGERPFVCTICSKSFTQSINLVCHMRTHTGERPFVCTMCTKSFTRRSSLIYHMRTHIDKKPFVCTLCSKSFTKNDSLVRHMRTHSD